MPRGIYSRPSSVERLMDSVKISKHNCWIWQKLKTKNGFPLIWIDGKERRADRYAYNLANGLEGFEIDGLTPIKTCKRNDCCNPAHMFLVPKIVLNRNSRKTHCKHGHPYTDGSFYRDKNGGRHCKSCLRISNQHRRGKSYENKESESHI
jgi:hypothetical protein